jgi:Vam6/Vps39-like protein vacuolar protein sorting-associated protein 39
VVDYLVSIKRDLGIRYLEHLINDLQELSPTFHDRLVALYLEEASDSATPESQRKEVRDKLVTFLEESDQYMPERVLAKLSRSTILLQEILTTDEQFLPEKAVVLSKMGQHKNALEIYIFKLKDYDKAERHHLQM